MTRKRRYLISAAVLAACVCITLGVLAMLPPQTGVTKANFDRVKTGMTLAEVQAILGEPDHRDADYPNGSFFCTWQRSDGADVNLPFDVNSTLLMPDWGTPIETIPDKLRRWLHLPK